MKPTQETLDKVEHIFSQIDGLTFHHHYHILLDIANTFKGEVNYLEIGCFGGGSASLLLSRNETNVYTIDLGHPISEEIATKNISKLNVLKNNYKYIKGDSQTRETKNKVLEHVQEIDMLFIDGDHSYKGVINDFYLYSPMVKKGGYIIFDDYNDIEFSPYVKVAVDDIIKNLGGYEIIGYFDNALGAKPKELEIGNYFIIKKI